MSMTIGTAAPSSAPTATGAGAAATTAAPFDAVLAAFETLAHLELLALQGKVGRSEVDGAAQFTPATGFPG